MTELQPFSWPARGWRVRVILIDDEPWFLASEVCAALGITNVGNAVARLDDDEKSSIRLTDGTPGNPNRAIVNEPGLYTLILRSDKPDARDFKRWVAHDILPTLRRYGEYRYDPADRRELEAPQWSQLDVARRYVAALEELEVARPKAEAFDAFLNGEGRYLIGTVAKMIGVRPMTLFGFLRDEKILIPNGKRRNEPYSLDKTAAWFDVKTHSSDRTNGRTSTTTYVTPYGAEQIRLLAVKRGLIQPQLLALTGGVES